MTQEELDRPLLRPDEEEEMNKTTKMERRKVWEWVKVNAQKAIWLRDRSENTIVEYVKLY